MCGFHRFPSLQLGVVQTQFRIGIHARLLTEPNSRVEVPQLNAGGQVDGPFLQGTVFGAVTRRGSDSDRCGGRNVTILERVQQSEIAERNEVCPELVHEHPLKFTSTLEPL